MKFKRDFVTPYLGVVFVVVALSGIFMFIHLLDDYTNVVHEFLGLTFVFFAILHILTNRKSIGIYSRKRKIFLPAITILVISISLIVIGKVKGNLERKLLEQMIRSPICYSFKTLNIDYAQAESILRQHDIIVKDTLQSIQEISAANNQSPEEVLELIYK